MANSSMPTMVDGKQQHAHYAMPHVAGSSLSEHIDAQVSLQARLTAISKDLVTADGTLTLPGISSEVLQQQFMFAVAVQEGAPATRRLLRQMQQAKQSLLQAARTGGCARHLPVRSAAALL